MKVAQKQLAFLNSENKIVRYWAILGLRSQNAPVLMPFRDEIIQSMNDDYDPVAVTAAAISYQNFANLEAEIKLKEYCKSDNMDLALMAINYLLYIDSKEPFVETIQSVYEMPGRNYMVQAACQDFMNR